jgi:hypothetical protein
LKNKHRHSQLSDRSSGHGFAGFLSTIVIFRQSLTHRSTSSAPPSHVLEFLPTMLAETDLNRLERQLADFNLATKARQDALDELTLTYDKLLEDYRVLRSDYEEEKESREKYKKLARGQDRNPFVLVLIDADGYVVSH